LEKLEGRKDGAKDGARRERGEKIISTIGLRINPLVGSGRNESLSTATASSKFGVALWLEKVETETGESRWGGGNLQEIINVFVQFPFLSCVMSHVGSQGELDLTLFTSFFHFSN